MNSWGYLCEQAVDVVVLGLLSHLCSAVAILGSYFRKVVFGVGPCWAVGPVMVLVCDIDSNSEAFGLVKIFGRG